MLQKARYGLNLNTGIGNRNWVFKTENCTLYKMASTRLLDIIKGSHHVFDGQIEYWNKVNEQNG